MEIAVIGAAGNVGAEVAFLIAHNELADKLILLDILEDKLKGTALDIEYACGHKKTKVVIGNYEDLVNAEIIIISAGKAMTTEASRDELLKINSKILFSILSLIKNEKALFVLINNPVDALVNKAVEFGIPRERVVGVSTLHDTIRLRAILKRQGIKDSKSAVHGKHGDGKFIINEDIDTNKLKEEVNESAKLIRKLRGHTSFGIAAATAEMVEAILNNKESIASIQEHGSVPVKFENFRVMRIS